MCIAFEFGPQWHGISPKLILVSLSLDFCSYWSIIMSDSPSSNNRHRPVSNPFAHYGTRASLSSDTTGARRESTPPTLLTRDSSSVYTNFGQSQQRPISYRMPAALDTIHEAPRRNRDSDATLMPEPDGKTSDPAVPPQTYRGNDRYGYDAVQSPRSSQIPPNAHQYYLPYYNNQGKRPKKSLVQRASEFFHNLAEDQEISSLPPSRETSERRYPISAGDNERTDNFDGKPDFGQPQTSTKDDIFLQAMEINGDIEVRDALAVDADVQLYPQPQPDKLTEIPQFFHKEKDVQNNNRVTSYRQRRKKPKHSIVYNRDCTFVPRHKMLRLKRSFQLSLTNSFSFLSSLKHCSSSVRPPIELNHSLPLSPLYSSCLPSSPTRLDAYKYLLAYLNNMRARCCL